MISTLSKYTDIRSQLNTSTKILIIFVKHYAMKMNIIRYYLLPDSIVLKLSN